MDADRVTPFQRKELCHKWAVSIAASIAAYYAYSQYQSQQAVTQSQQVVAQEQTKLFQEQVVALRQKLEADREADRHRLDQERNEREKDYRVRFFERRVAVYEELCDVASRITTHTSTDSAKGDIERFCQLCLGKATAVADQQVADAMWAFNDGLLNLGAKKKYKSPTELQPLSFDVARACKASLHRAFPTIPFAEKVGNVRTGGVGYVPNDAPPPPFDGRPQ